jgi:hypothetical protein
MIYDWALVAVLSTSVHGITKVEYTVIDYFKNKQECMAVSKQQPKIFNSSFMCLPIDRN